MIANVQFSKPLCVDYNWIVLLAFAAGVAAFLLMFKRFVIPFIAPQDEISPTLVVAMSLVNGWLVATAVQYLLKKRLKA